MAGRSLARNPCVRCANSQWVRGCRGRAPADMECPETHPLDELIDALADQGYEAYFDDIDSRMATSELSLCTNCGARGGFTYVGVKSGCDYRAFLSCRACRHWVEV